MKQFLFYICYSANWIITLLPMRVLYIFSWFLFIILNYIVKYRRNVIEKNLKNSFPEKSEKEISEIRKKYMRHLSDVIIESLATEHISEKQFKKRIKYKNPEILDKFWKEGKSIIGVTGHINNWEWYTTLPLIMNYKVIAIFKPMSNKYFEWCINKLRNKFGVEPVAMKNTLRTLLNYVKQNTKTYTLSIADQVPLKNEIQFWTPFLNQDTPVFLGTEKLARKLNQAIVFLAMRKIKRGYYEVEMIPVTDNAKNEEPLAITVKHTQILEKEIRNAPEQWMWSHRRWKHKREVVDQ
ncbi:MAG: lipid A biosynthesis acyltransferase [Marinilabiliales bacterium]|nr:MAG: lipid A biosynthesis acyltransferase [Marinilabiliales bacterium]